jgi:hypothetical protein
MRLLNPTRIITALTAVTLLTACDSGSDSPELASANDSTGARESSDIVSFAPSPNDQLITITSDNALLVTADVMQLMALTGSIGNEEGALGPLEAFVGEQSSDFNFSGFTGANADEFLQFDAEGLADGITEIDCPVAGRFVLEVDAPDPDPEAEPSSLAIHAAFSRCDLGDGLLLDGTLDVSATGPIEDLEAGLGAPGTSELTISAVDLEVHQAAFGFQTNGVLNIGIMRSDSEFTLSITSESFAYAGLNSAMIWDGLVLNAGKNLATNSYSFDVNGGLMLNLHGINGKVELETLQKFTGIGDMYPTTGELQVLGANGSSLTVTTVAGGAIAIQVNGDDPVVIYSSWETLKALLAQ